jgi:hypothetical protein
MEKIPSGDVQIGQALFKRLENHIIPTWEYEATKDGYKSNLYIRATQPSYLGGNISFVGSYNDTKTQSLHGISFSNIASSLLEAAKE